MIWCMSSNLSSSEYHKAMKTCILLSFNVEAYYITLVLDMCADKNRMCNCKRKLTTQDVWFKCDTLVVWHASYDDDCIKLNIIDCRDFLWYPLTIYIHQKWW